MPEAAGRVGSRPHRRRRRGAASLVATEHQGAAGATQGAVRAATAYRARRSSLLLLGA
jgi:hypothetical protein